jgi:hypothetical protein
MTLDKPSEADGALKNATLRFGSAFGKIDPKPRMEKERAGTRTPAERARSSKEPQELINFRVPRSARMQLKEVAALLGVSMTEVFLRGLEHVAKEAKKDVKDD